MSSPATGTKVSRGNKWAARITITGLSVLLMISVLVYVTKVLGFVQGEEIAAETFQRRSFAYYQIPLIELQITGIIRADVTGELETFLVKQKLISVPAAKLPDDATMRWDLINSHRGGNVFSRGEAEILRNYLDARDAEGKHAWVKWSKEHKTLAKVIWPAVVEVAQQELYIFVPEMLELAANSSDADALQVALDELRSEQYLRVATTQQQLARHELAVELFSHSLDRSPSQLAALERRAVSLAALGKQDQAAADLAEVRQLRQL